MSSEMPVLSWAGVSLDFAVASLDPGMVKCLDDRIQEIRERISVICREHKWTLSWILAQDPETLDNGARLVLDTHNLIEYLEYLKRGSG